MCSNTPAGQHFRGITVTSQVHKPLVFSSLIIAVFLIGARPAAASSVLIRNVIVVDGSGSPGYAADVRIQDNLIAETGWMKPKAGQARRC